MKESEREGETKRSENMKDVTWRRRRKKGGEGEGSGEEKATGEVGKEA